MIALDSNVLIDLLIGDSTYAESSEACIGEALAHDDVVVCEAVVAEVQAMLDTTANLMAAHPGGTLEDVFVRTMQQ